jgi:hypothetical protein
MCPGGHPSPLAILAILVIAVAGVAPAASASTCKRPRGASLIAASPTAVVWSRQARGVRRVGVGCLRATGRRTVLAVGLDSALDGSVLERPIVLAGHYVGYVMFNSFEARAEYVVRIADLRSGRIRGHTAWPDNSVDSQSVAVRGLVLNRSGGIAWVTWWDGYPHAATQKPVPSSAVARLDTNGLAELDGGPAINPDSLALATGGGSITWVDGGQRRTAPLVGAAP